MIISKCRSTWKSKWKTYTFLFIVHIPVITLPHASVGCQPLHYLMVMQILLITKWEVQMQNGSVRWEVQRWMGLSKYYAKCLVDSHSIFCQAFSFSPLQAKINQWTYFGPMSKTSPIACTQHPWKEEGLDSRHVSSCPSLKHMLHEYLGSDSNRRAVCQRY